MSELEALKKQLAEAEARLAAQPKSVIKMKISEKGNLSIMGLKPGWPINMDPEVWRLMDAHRDQIKKFLDEQKK